MIDYKKQICESIAKLTNLNCEELIKYIEIPPNSEMGDYTFPCFKLAKELHKAPPVIANEIRTYLLENDPKLAEMFSKIESVSRISKFLC